MPPTSSLRTFIEALRTGETRTTQALEAVVPGLRAVDTVASHAGRVGAFNTPLADEFRERLRSAQLPDDAITHCIDGWPDEEKEFARQQLVLALSQGATVRFRWGLTAAPEYEVLVDASEPGVITITGLSPRSTLTIYDGDQVAVGPATPSGG